MTALGPLLSHAIIDISRDFTGSVAAGGVDKRLTLPLWSNLLRPIPDEGISFSDLPAATRISRRVLRTAEARAWVEVTPLQPRGNLWRLVPAGRDLRERGIELVEKNETQWRAKVGDAQAERLRAALEAFVGQLDFELPHYPMAYGGVDRSALGGFAVPAKPGPPPIPPHGTDWVPVIRGDGDTVSSLPLHALLSQAYMAFKVDCEARFILAISDVARIAELMPTGEAPLADVAALGVTGEGKSGLERHGVVKVSGRGNNRIARLTPVAQRLPGGYEPVMAHVEAKWRERVGGRVVTDLRKSLEKVEGRVRAGLADHVLLWKWADV